MSINLVSKHSYIYTFAGKCLYPFDLKQDMIVSEDIANGLGRECRFGNQSDKFYSVAQHSVLIAQLVPPEMRLWALLHDASEAYTGDMPKPLKVAIPDFKEFENKLSKVIFEAAGLYGECPELIKEIDSRIVIDEALQVFIEPPPWAKEASHHKIGIEITPWPEQAAKVIYLRSLQRLLGFEITQERAYNLLRIPYKPKRKVTLNLPPKGAA